MPRDRQRKQQAAEIEKDSASKGGTRTYLKKQLARFREYTSFTTLDDNGQGKKYDLKMPETATGLLRDVVATTRRLSAEQRRQKAFTEEAFAAYCMYICATKCTGVNLDDVMSDVYRETFEWLKKNLENGDMKSFHSYLITRAKWRYRDILRKRRVTITGEDGRSLTASRRVPLEADGTIETDDEKLKEKCREEIFAQGARAMVLEIDKADVNRAIEVCFEKGMLTEEQVVILCHVYGLGDGYDLLSQTEVAQKLRKSDSYVSRHLNRAIEALKNSGLLPPFQFGVSLK